ncbi:TIGR01212 family radical SAM protein [bacterium]|nr:TIGR01212 family radical SAM protein [bacterium]
MANVKPLRGHTKRFENLVNGQAINPDKFHLNPLCEHLKRYRDFNTWLRSVFGVKVHKITIDAGLYCPNRDGSISRNGCIYCNQNGSGTGAWEKGMSVRNQVLAAQVILKERFKAKKFLAYFQSFTNTYAPKEKLDILYSEALNNDDMVGLCIGTRPDCVPEDILSMIEGYVKDYMVWIEYGLQSFHDNTLKRINRGHTVAQFMDAVRRTRQRKGINVCVHVILGLPGETKKDMIRTAKRISGLDIQGIKIHLLYVIKGTPLADLYESGEYECLTQSEYLDILASFISCLRPDIIIQRLTGDPHPDELLAPLWSLRKQETLRMLNEKMEREDIWQGKEYS